MSETSKQSGKKVEICTRRVFSEEFKKQKVQMLIDKKVTIAELSTLYKVSKMTIYRWLYKYSPHHNKGTIQVIQMESEGAKNIALLKQISDLERAVGQKQLQIDFLEKLLEIASEGLKVDIKKNFNTQPLNGSVKESPNTTGQ